MVECEHLSASVLLKTTEVSKVEPQHWACAGKEAESSRSSRILDVCFDFLHFTPILLQALILTPIFCSLQVTEKPLDLPCLWYGPLRKVNFL